MVIKRYIVTICTDIDEQDYRPGQISDYVLDGLVNDNESGVTAAVVDAEYLDDVDLLYHTAVVRAQNE